MSELKKIELAEMLAELRAQLSAARGEGEGQDLKLEVSEVELEVEVETTREAQGKGGVKFWVYDAEASAKGTQGRTHRLKLRLKPTGPQGEGPVRISAAGQLPR